MTPAARPTPPQPGSAAPADPDTVFAAPQQHGWHRERDAAGGLTCASPDRRCTVRYGPHTGRLADDPARLWSAAYRPGLGEERAWLAEFSAGTPAAALAAFLGTLADPAGIRGAVPGHLAGGGESELVFAATEADGWIRAVRTATRREAHRILRLAFPPSPPPVPGQFLAAGPHWRVYGDDPRDRTVWSALLTGDTPAEAIAAFLHALTGPDPDPARPRHTMT